MTLDAAGQVTFARKIAMDRLAERDRSRHELLTSLAKRNVPDDVAAAVVDRLADEGFVDDARFAQAWVAARHRSKGLAPRALRLELERKGVARDHIDAALDEVDVDSQRQAAHLLVQRKLRSMSGLADDVKFRRLTGLLARKGYSPSIAIEVVRTAVAACADLDAPRD